MKKNYQTPTVLELEMMPTVIMALSKLKWIKTDDDVGIDYGGGGNEPPVVKERYGDLWGDKE